MGQYKYDVIADSTGVTNITLNSSGVPTFTNSPQFNSAGTTYASSPANIATSDRYALIGFATGTVNLPAHSAAGRILTIKKTHATWGNCTLTPTTGTIDGAATKVITTQYDAVTLYDDGTNWYAVDVDLVVNSAIALQGGSGYGSTLTNVRRLTNVTTNTGAGMTLTQSATNGDSITINEAGVYSATITDFSSVTVGFFIQKNDTTNGLVSGTLGSFVNVAGSQNCAAGATICAAGDIIRSCSVAAGTPGTSTVIFGVTQIKRIF